MFCKLHWVLIFDIASEGHLECVEFLLKVCQVDPSSQDRWGHTALSEAQRFGHKPVADLLEKWHSIKPDGDNTDESKKLFKP